MVETDIQEKLGFSHYGGKALNSLVEIIKDVTEVVLVAGVIGYIGTSFVYGPYDTGKVIYAQLSGDKSTKHRAIEEAKYLFARKSFKKNLDEEDLKNFYLELKVVSSDGKKPTEEDISWYYLLDWIEDNN